MSKTIIAYKEATNLLSIREKVGQFFMPAAFINDSEPAIQRLENLIKSHHIGGICFFHSRASAATNYEGKKKVIYNADSFKELQKLIKRYQSVSKYPLLISIDAEWGLAMRVEDTPQYPYPLTLGAANDLDLVFKVGQKVAEDCKIAGIHWNFAPVGDINDNPENPVIGYRSFGSDKAQVAANAIAFSKGMQSVGMLSCIKHFPGHGDTATDSHLGLPVINKTKEELVQNEFIPFQELIRNGVDSVMVGHLSVPEITSGKQTSASISKEMIKGVLRSDLGYNGVVVSDALNMHSVSKLFDAKGALEWIAFDAGNDVLCFAENVPEGIKTIMDKATKDQVETSFERVWKLKEKALNNEIEKPVALSNPLQLNNEVSLKSLTLFKGDESGIAAFRKEDFMGISVTNTNKNIFFEKIAATSNIHYRNATDANLKVLKEELKDVKNILLAIDPPSMKPKDNFSVPPDILVFIKEIIATKKVLIYLFGNPYLLRALPHNNTVGVVIAYQNFSIFQENAADHFLGKITAEGTLSVAL
ncbi:MAG: glycoside hydrolase family 3 protein [Eudoraea sp.]|nr:glycoside hydrolase family 3 protein [Eudoraea sp.]